jgi:hypothetical protein
MAFHGFREAKGDAASTQLLSMNALKLVVRFLASQSDEGSVRREMLEANALRMATVARQIGAQARRRRPPRLRRRP